MALDLYANFERCSNSSVFYRKCTSTPVPIYGELTSHDWRISVYDSSDPEADISGRYEMNISFGSYDPNQGLSQKTYDPEKKQYIPGNPYWEEEAQIFEPNENGVFVKHVNWDTKLPCVCAVKVSVTDLQSIRGPENPKDYILSGVFVEEEMWPNLDFIAWPRYQINPAKKLIKELIPTDSSVLGSDGVYFYGEGHTETISMRAISATTFNIDAPSFVESYQIFDKKVSEALAECVDEIYWYVGHNPIKLSEDGNLKNNTAALSNNTKTDPVTTPYGKEADLSYGIGITQTSSKQSQEQTIKVTGSVTINKYTITLDTPLNPSIKPLYCTVNAEINGSTIFTGTTNTILNITEDRKTLNLQKPALKTASKIAFVITNKKELTLGNETTKASSTTKAVLILNPNDPDYNLVAGDPKPIKLAIDLTKYPQGIYPKNTDTFLIQSEDSNFKLGEKLQPYVDIDSTLNQKLFDDTTTIFSAQPEIKNILPANNTIQLNTGLTTELMVVPHVVILDVPLGASQTCNILSVDQEKKTIGIDPKTTIINSLVPGSLVTIEGNQYKINSVQKATGLIELDVVTMPDELPDILPTITVYNETAENNKNLLSLTRSLKPTEQTMYVKTNSPGYKTFFNEKLNYFQVGDLPPLSIIPKIKIGDKYFELIETAKKNLTYVKIDPTDTNFSSIVKDQLVTGTGIAAGTKVTQTNLQGVVALTLFLTADIPVPSAQVNIDSAPYFLMESANYGSTKIVLNKANPFFNTWKDKSVTGYGIASGTTVSDISLDGTITLSKTLTATLNVTAFAKVTKKSVDTKTPAECTVTLDKPLNLTKENKEATFISKWEEKQVQLRFGQNDTDESINANTLDFYYDKDTLNAASIKDGALLKFNTYFDSCEISEPIKTREITIDNTDYKISSLAKKAAEGKTQTIFLDINDSEFIKNIGDVRNKNNAEIKTIQTTAATKLTDKEIKSSDLYKSGSSDTFFTTTKITSVKVTSTSCTLNLDKPLLKDLPPTSYYSFKISKQSRRKIFKNSQLVINKSLQPWIAKGNFVEHSNIAGAATITEVNPTSNTITLTGKFNTANDFTSPISISGDINYGTWYTNSATFTTSQDQQEEYQYPISMWATNKRIKQDSYITYDDISGIPKYYPFFASTITPLGKEEKSLLKQNITIKPYPEYQNLKLTSAKLTAEKFNLPFDFSSTTLDGKVEFLEITEPTFLTEKYTSTSWMVSAGVNFGEEQSQWSQETGRLTAKTDSTLPITTYKFDMSYEKVPSESFLTTWFASPIVDTTIGLTVSAEKTVDFILYDYKGNYSETATYSTNQVVLYNNTRYQSLANNNKGVLPTGVEASETHWSATINGIEKPSTLVELKDDWQPKTVTVSQSLQSTITQIPYTNIYVPNYYNEIGKDAVITIGVWHPSIDKFTITSPGFSERPATIDVSKKPIWNYRGDYSSTVTYYEGDTVTYLSKTYLYISSTSSKGNLPNTDKSLYWVIASEKNRPFYKTTLNFNRAGIAPLKIEATVNDEYTSNTPKTVTFTLDTATEIVQEYDADEQVLADRQNPNRSLSKFILTYKEAPKINPNEWAIADNINAIIEKFNLTIDEIDLYTKRLLNKSKLYAWWGPEYEPKFIPKLVWEDLECKDLYDDSIKEITWMDLTKTAELSSQYTWKYNTCDDKFDPSGLGKYCVPWTWNARKTNNSAVDITWDMTKQRGGAFPKRWTYERCDKQEDPRSCFKDSWNVITIDTEAFPIYYSRYIERCSFVSCGAYPERDRLISIYPREVILHINDYEATKLDTATQIDEYLAYQNIVAASYGDNGIFAVLDKTLPRVTVYQIKGDNLSQMETWSSYGPKSSAGLNQPTDIHIDGEGFVWIVDAGNKCVKQFNIKGKLMSTIYIPEFETNTIKSVCVDSDNKVHCLVGNEVYVFVDGEVVFNYGASSYVTEARKIQTSYNRQMVYMSHSRGICKFYKNGTFSYDVELDLECADKTNIQEFDQMYQDSGRNLYVVCKDKVLKYADLQKIMDTKATIGDKKWKPEDLMIDKEEYIQPWVYLRVFHRLWDNIEILRNSLFYELTGCKSFTAPTYSKDQILIGQNELVTNAVINRLSSQLWTNLSSMFKYFDPNCKN